MTPTRESVPSDALAESARPRPARIAWRWLPALLWLALILFASSDAFSSSQTSRFLEPALRWLFPTLGPQRILEIHALIRKAAHLTEYAVLAILFWRALRGTTTWLTKPRQTAWRWMPALGALGTAALCAVVDELHQSTVPSRTGSARDVALDICGAALALFLVRVVFSLRSRIPARATARM